MNKKIFHLLRTTALLTALSLFALLTFESLHDGHEEHCHEDACPVCLVLQVIHNTKIISDEAPITLVEILSFTYSNLLILSALYLMPLTLIKQKVMLLI